jgi:hypothetical protein
MRCATPSAPWPGKRYCRRSTRNQPDSAHSHGPAPCSGADRIPRQVRGMRGWLTCEFRNRLVIRNLRPSGHWRQNHATAWGSSARACWPS